MRRNLAFAISFALLFAGWGGAAFGQRPEPQPCPYVTVKANESHISRLPLVCEVKFQITNVYTLRLQTHHD